jgi:putative spermidine/putrescine transport system ATP-binding protein
VSDLRLPGAAIDLVGLTRSFGEFRAVDEVDLAIEAGEFMTFLGPSGSGKTTTLNMIAGFINPTGGDIKIAGRSVLDVPTHKRELGMVFQGYALFPHMTVAENVAFPLKQRRTSRREREIRVEAALSTVELPHLGHRRCAELSGGQQQRVALARAIVYGPPVLLMDEPLGALDKKLRENLQGEIRRIHLELGTTFIYVTHDQEEALSLSDRIAVYDQGKIAQVGTGQELYERPATLFVAEFLGESTLIHGRIEDGARDVLVTPEGRLSVENPTDARGNATLMVRPERVELTCVKGTVDSGGPLVAVIDDVYLGHARKLTIRFRDGRVGTVREAPGRHSNVRTGDEAVMHWERSSGILLPTANLMAQRQLRPSMVQ